MAFYVDFCNTSDEECVVNKRTTYDSKITINVNEAKGPINILNMTLILAYNENLPTTNYAYIDTFKRWYFVDWTLETDERLIAKLRVDPLKSHEEDILDITAILVRVGDLTRPTFVEDNLIPFDSRERISFYSAASSIHADTGHVAYTLMLHTI